MHWKKAVLILFCIIVVYSAFGCGFISKENIQDSASTEYMYKGKWLDEENYMGKLLENRAPISECRENYESEAENIRNAEYENLSFSSTDFVAFPKCEDVSLLREEKIIITPQESWDMIEQWLDEIGKSEMVDMEKEVRVVTSEVEWDESQEYPYCYPALADHMDIKDASGAFISTKDCEYMVCYEQADGKMSEYLGIDDLAYRETSGEYAQDVEVAGTLEELGEQTYPLISGQLSIQEGADLLMDYFDHGTVTKPADGVTLGVENVRVFHLNEVFGYCYTVHRVYRGVPVSCVEKSGVRLAGCPYLPAEDSKKVYIVDDTGVSVSCGNSECSPLSVLYRDTKILSAENAAGLLSEKLAPGLRMDVAEMSFVYAPYEADMMDPEKILFPSWRFEGRNNTKGEKLVAYVDALTGDLYYYVIPEWHQVE